MAKKKQLLTVFATIEGSKRERIILSILEKIYLDRSLAKLTIHPKHGGNPDALLDDTLRYLHHGYDRMFIWIDEDIDLSLASRKKLFKEWKVNTNEENDFYACGRLMNHLSISFFAKEIK